jgi:hypothetical protein
MMVHHTSRGIYRSTGQSTSGNSGLGDQPDLYISRSSSKQVCRSNSRPTIEDNQSVDRLAEKLTMSWMHGRSGRASFFRLLDSADLT